MKFFCWLFAATLLTAGASHATRPRPTILSGSTLSVSTLGASLADVKAGTIVVLGEQHRNDAHQAYQLMVMAELRARGLAVSVGMEFLDRSSQVHVDAFRQGRTNEAEFLTAVAWKGSFDHYRDQILFPVAPQSTLALNLPRRVTGIIARSGVQALSAEDRELLPKEFAVDGRGNERYFQRFSNVMQRKNIEADKIENYFMAQSAWDATMTWTAADYIRRHPDEVLVIIVGDFHVAYGGGLPERLRKRGISDIVSISMLDTTPMSEVEKDEQVAPHGPDGPRADWIWLTPAAGQDANR